MKEERTIYMVLIVGRRLKQKHDRREFVDCLFPFILLHLPKAALEGHGNFEKRLRYDTKG